MANTPRAIDMHFHAIPPGFVDAVRRGDLADTIELDPAGARLVFHAPPGVAVEPNLSLRPKVYDAPLLLDAMDHMRLDTAAVSSPPEYFMYWATPEAGERIARAVNDGYADWARAHPDRFAPLVTVPMQDPARAVRELHRAVGTLGLRGVAICTHVNGTDLDDIRFDPFYAAVQALDVPLFLHPQNAGDITRLSQYHLWNMVGFPAETAIAAARLIMSGVFARHPPVKVVLAHGGGFLPYQLGRLDHGWRVRPGLDQACPEPPSAYLRNIWCDSLVHAPDALDFLLRRLGEDHVVLGTDHPFDMGDHAPLQALRHLPDPVARKVAGGTLSRLLRLD